MPRLSTRSAAPARRRRSSSRFDPSPNCSLVQQGYVVVCARPPVSLRMFLFKFRAILSICMRYPHQISDPQVTRHIVREPMYRANPSIAARHRFTSPTFRPEPRVEIAPSHNEYARLWLDQSCIPSLSVLHTLARKGRGRKAQRDMTRLVTTAHSAPTSRFLAGPGGLT